MLPSSPQRTTRPLGSGEELWVRLGEIASNNALVVVELGAELEHSRLREAIQSAADAHPILGARIHKIAQTYHIVFGDKARFGFTVHTKEAARDWQQVVHEELNTALPWDGPHLWRVTVVESLQSSHLILCSNHAIGDGMSIVELLRSIFAIYTGATTPESKLPPPAMESLYKSRHSFVQQSRHTLGHIRNFLRHRKLAVYRLADAPLVDSEGPSSSFETHLLTQEESKSLQSLAKQKAVTLHGLLCAAMVMAIYEDSQTSSRLPIGVSTVVNIRGDLKGDRSRDFAYYVALTDGIADVSADKDFWTLAAHYSTVVHEQRNKESYRFQSRILRLLLAKHKDTKVLLHTLRDRSKSTVMITNLGRIDVPQDWGALQIKQLFTVPSTHALGRPYIVLTASTFAEQLRLTFSYGLPFTQKEQVERIIRGMRAKLERLSH